MSDQQKLELQLTGLYTAPNNLSGVPAGALEIADNVVINSKSRIDSRRGQTQYGEPVDVGTGQINKIFNYASSLIQSYDNKLAYDSGNGAWVDYIGDYLAPAMGYKMRSLEALKNFYFTTSEGIYKIDALTSTPRKAGVVRALGGTGVTTGSTGFLLDDTAVAYRLVWGYTDENNNLLLGAPSQRVVVANDSGGAKDVELTFSIPASITTEYFYQIYRSQGSVGAAVEPNDELQLVLQGNPTSGEIAAKEFTIIDQTPYSLMRATLYTAPSQEGIVNANLEPPFAKDMDIFKGSAFYANIKQKQTLAVALISVGSPSLGYLTLAGDTTNGNAVVDGISSTTEIHVGMRVIGSGIQADTVVESVDSGTEITLSKTATITAAGVSLEFQDRFSIGGVDYWAGSTQNAATNTFLVDTSGTPGQNINQTALNLLEIVNTSADNTTIYGYYTSSVEDLPGQMLFEERSIGGVAFAATSSAGTSFSPALPDKRVILSNTASNPTVVFSALPHGLSDGDSVYIFDTTSTPPINGKHQVTVVSSTRFSVPIEVTVDGFTGYYVRDDEAVVSANDERQNRVAISKPSQVEAVPAYSYFDIGSANFPIERVVALRDGIFFFKTDGIYRLSGETFSSFTVDLVDNTVILKVPESAVPFNNQVFCFTTQGVCAVTDSGVQIMSVAIENTLLELSSEQYTNFAKASFGVAYESARLYMFFTVSEEDDTFATQAFIYNSLTSTWTRWVMNRVCGVVNTTVNKLFMAEADSGQVLIERKTYTNADFADEQYPVEIVTVNSATEIVVASTENLAVGMTIVQNFREALIEEINDDVITILRTTGLLPGEAVAYEPIENLVRWAPIDVDNPGILKQFSEISLFFRNAAFREIDATFSTNVSLSGQTVMIANLSSNGWGLQGFGTFQWGGQPGGQSVLRTYVPREKQRAHWMYLSLATRQAFTGFSLQGVSLIFNNMTSRFR